MYTDRNYKTNKYLVEAVKDSQKIGVYHPGPFGGAEPTNGEVSVEGPHYPAAHAWYARVTLQDGFIVKVK
jgi:hypothetical protein